MEDNNFMEVIKLEEAGFESTLYGLSLSFKEERIPYTEWFTKEKYDKTVKLAEKQAQMDGGHNKFLESIITWWYIKAPRYVWSEMDTYRLETKNSASTMHTIQKYELTEDDFEEGTDQIIINRFNALLRTVTKDFKETKRLSDKELVLIKSNLPEGYLQTRQWRLSYKTLRNIILQRRNHRLPQWRFFISEVLKQVNHSELLPSMDNTP